MSIVTPTVRSRLRRASFWIGLVSVALVIAIVVMLAQGALRTASETLAPDNAAPSGGMAVAEVLRNEGVTVEKAGGYAVAELALERLGPGETTLFVVDPEGHLSGERLAALREGVAALVILAPTRQQLDAVAPMLRPGGIVASTEPDAEAVAPLESGCGLRAAENAKRIQGAGLGYRIAGEQGTITGCFDGGDGLFAVVQVADESGSVTVIGIEAVFRNESVVDAGNAAFALTVLGSQKNLLWYLPSVRDSGQPIPLTLEELTPNWYTPVVLLLLGVAVAIAFWRGRRLGPIVVENLPVTVPSSETMEGRARLYQASNARLHSLDALRIGTIGRIARNLGLSRDSDVDTVARAAANALDRPTETVHALLVGAEPSNDSELVRLSDELLRLESDITTATRPGSPRGE